MERPARFA